MHCSMAIRVCVCVCVCCCGLFVGCKHVVVVVIIIGLYICSSKNGTLIAHTPTNYATFNIRVSFRGLGVGGEASSPKTT